ncbi:CRISPR-associated protein Cas4 [Desulfuribacillus stibiiarsenatis]|uniref:CRISPR-associated exonuclease Cas4 n=1 Tax=Desulfuribacillus stibiiarsenatis TaxID=1390249 RepID=A0A1E5L471_9FIRM|nr:CRISPR-associated protein Cas4 [Desulfuribacillus stibiiarsenatis]OEH84884.1 CRISPR-associated protein Cas4 [Desulfuribacillus stibiiarsenatis]
MHDQSIGGIDLQYYELCKRKLWLYRKGINMEEESDYVLQGKVLHERSYPRLLDKERLIDDAFAIDAIDGEYVREVKLSSKMSNADKMQMLFYLYQLSLRGIYKKGLISYTKERRTEEIELTESNQKQIISAIGGVYEIINLPTAPPVKKFPYCKSCAYYEFCYSREDD